MVSLHKIVLIASSCRNRKGKKNTSPWFDVSVSNAVPSTLTKSKNAATYSSLGAVTRSQTASQASPGPVTRSQVASEAATPPPKSPAKGKKKKMTPKKKKVNYELAF